MFQKEERKKHRHEHYNTHRGTKFMINSNSNFQLIFFSRNSNYCFQILVFLTTYYYF